MYVRPCKSSNDNIILSWLGYICEVSSDCDQRDKCVGQLAEPSQMQLRVAIQSLFFAPESTPESTPERTVESNFEKDTCMNFMFQKDFQY